MTESVRIQDPALPSRASTASQEAHVLTTREKVGYALGDSASNFYWKVFEFYTLFFYTDVFGLSAKETAWLVLASRLWDGISDPLMGALADRTRTKWGKFRPWLLWGAVPIWAAGVLMFTTPALEGGAKLAYAYVTYMFMMLMYTAINIPYSALMGVITPHTQERSQLSSWRFVGAFSVALVVQTFTPRFVALAGGDDAQKGWQLVMLGYGAIAAVLFLLCFFTTKERIQPTQVQRASFRDELRALRTNTPWQIMFGMGVLVIAGFALRGGTIAYYFKYYLPEAGPYTLSLGPLSFTYSGMEAFFMSGGIAALIGTMLMPWGTKFFGKRTLYIVCMGGAGLFTIPYFFLTPDSIGPIYTLNLIISFLLGPSAPLIFVMFTDTADYGEWKTGLRTTGLVMAAAMLSLKIGGTIGGFCNGMILDAYGFVANQEQSPEAIAGILILMGLVPAVTTIGAAGLALAYPLTDAHLADIERELRKRRERETLPDLDD